MQFKTREQKISPLLSLAKYPFSPSYINHKTNMRTMSLEHQGLNAAEPKPPTPSPFNVSMCNVSATGSHTM